ncbi:MAG: trigger factor [Armatimonadota bacterium]|nr:trigger factor [Armatimonadota bacterium]MDR7533396.1 trigger factor [Armatimonadota bacterium]MDR7535236.1 trigger factor [Armatimonadota bacterium]
MKVEWRRESPSRAVLDVEVPAGDVGREVQAAAARLARQVRVPGFRPGRAPRAVLERYVGRDEIYSEALEGLVAAAYRRAVAEAGVVPVGRPEFEVPALDETQPLRFTARVDIAPDVDPGDYAAVRVPYAAPVVADADVDAAIEDLRRRRGRLVSVQERAARGDFVLVRPTTVDGVERFAVGREVLVELGAGVLPPEVEAGLEGVAAGDERTLTVGEAGRLVLAVIDVRRRELPPLDDAFARGVGNVASLDELRAQLRQQLEREAAARAQEAYEEQVLTAVLERAAVELPVSMVEHELDHLVEELQEALQRRGITLERYLASTGQGLDALRAELRPRAERRLRVRLVLDAIADREGLAPTQEEITAEEEKLAADLGLDLPRVRDWLAEGTRRDAMQAVLRRRTTIATLVARARGEVDG